MAYVKILFPNHTIVKTEQLESILENSLDTIRKVLSNLGEQPGIVGNKNSDDLKITDYSSDGDNLSFKIQPGIGVTFTGKIIVIPSVITVNVSGLSNWNNKYITLNYQTQTTSSLQTIKTTTGETIDVSVERVSDSSIVTFEDTDLSDINDVIILGMFKWDGSDLTYIGNPPYRKYFSIKVSAKTKLSDYTEVTGNFVTFAKKDDGSDVKPLSPYIYEGGFYLVDSDNNQYLQISYSYVKKVGNIVIPSTIIINNTKIEESTDIKTGYPVPGGSGNDYSVSFYDGTNLASKGLWFVYIEYDETQNPPFVIRRELIFEYDVDDPYDLYQYSVILKEYNPHPPFFDWKERVTITYVRLPGLLEYMTHKMGNGYEWWYNKKRLPLAFIWVDHTDVDSDGNDEIVFAKTVVIQPGPGVGALKIYNCYQDTVDDGKIWPESTGRITNTNYVPYYQPTDSIRGTELKAFDIITLDYDLFDMLERKGKKIDNATTTNRYFRNKLTEWIEKHESTENPIIYSHDASQIKRNDGYTVLDDDNPYAEEDVDSALNKLVEYVKYHAAYDYVIIATGDETKDRQALIDAFSYLDHIGGGSLMIRGTTLNLGSDPLTLICHGRLYINSGRVFWWTPGSTLDKDIQVIQGQTMYIEGGYFYGQTIRGEEVYMKGSGGAIHIELRESRYKLSSPNTSLNSPTRFEIEDTEQLTDLYLLGHYEFGSDFYSPALTTATPIEGSSINIEGVNVNGGIYTYGYNEDGTQTYKFDTIRIEKTYVSTRFNIGINITVSNIKVIDSKLEAINFIGYTDKTEEYLSLSNDFVIDNCILNRLHNMQIYGEKLVILNSKIKLQDILFAEMNGFEIRNCDFLDYTSEPKKFYLLFERLPSIIENCRFNIKDEDITYEPIVPSSLYPITMDRSRQLSWNDYGFLFIKPRISQQYPPWSTSIKICNNTFYYPKGDIDLSRNLEILQFIVKTDGSGGYTEFNADITIEGNVFYTKGTIFNSTPNIACIGIPIGLQRNHLTRVVGNLLRGDDIPQADGDFYLVYYSKFSDTQPSSGFVATFCIEFFANRLPGAAYWFIWMYYDNENPPDESPLIPNNGQLDQFNTVTPGYYVF